MARRSSTAWARCRSSARTPARPPASSTSASTCCARAAALGIYPEGTRSPDGRLYKFRTGVARVALRSGAPVVPVGLVGTARGAAAGRAGGGTARRWASTSARRCTSADRAGEERSARVLREVTETIREAVQALSGQEYVDAYAGSTPLTRHRLAPGRLVTCHAPGPAARHS